MDARPPDTTPDVDHAQVEVYRRMGGSGRSDVMFRLTALAREAALAGIRHRHPDYDEETVRRAYARVVLGEEIARQVWPGVTPIAP